MSVLQLRAADLPNGVHIQYLDGGDGPPVAFFHGAGGVEPRAAFFPALAAQYHVLAPSRCGYDDSSGPSSNAREEGEIMGAFLQQVVGGPVALIAESAGGAAGCWTAVLYPALVDRLILVAPTAFLTGDHRAPGAPPPTPEAMELRLFGSHPAWTEPPTQQDVERRQRNVARNRDRIRAPDGNQELLGRLSDIAAPTLIVWGSHDQVAPAELSHPYQQAIPNSYRRFIYGAAHSLPIAACQQFVHLATEFIERGDAFVVRQPDIPDS